MASIVTHTSPDWDSITSCWFLERFSSLREIDVVYVDADNLDPALLAAADAVVAIGTICDPDRHRFPLLSQLYDDLCKEAGDMPQFWPLIEIAGDKPAAAESRLRDMHALLSEWKAQTLSDQELMQRGYALLDTIASGMARGLRFADALAAALVPYASDIASEQRRLGLD